MSLDLAQLAAGLLEAAPDAIVGVDEQGAIVLVNAQAERVFGYPRGELLGQRLELLVPSSARELHPKHRRAYVDDPVPRPMGAGLSLAGRRRDGTEFPAEISLSAIHTRDGVVVTAAVRDVTDRLRIERELRDKNAELERLGKAKDAFFASMSHELRTPLNAIIGFTSTLLMELPGPLNEEQARQLRTVEHSGRHLLAIINDILDLARIESGAVEVTLEHLDCGEVVDSVTSSLRPLAVERGLDLVVTRPAEPVVAVADARALGQILINLVGNAIKFTDVGRVEVTVTRDADGPAIAVRDTGPGIGDADLHRIFNAFERGGRAASSIKEGTGLGLYISHKLAELIGAEVSVDTDDGAGTTFTVRLDG
ncbi:MAG TPA: PAS domain-containing sensor histidine kinase [Jatrophihabitans sp.]|uniref:PAS domain-containing sensor histidine kinase n=1 Tax=Jatrophihabitans sp. TaxID=1932789 RepID=UPI002E03414D|nr:PAS domain-containing sensor histidine kinase [Jatrophihabitans sp.]